MQMVCVRQHVGCSVQFVCLLAVGVCSWCVSGSMWDAAWGVFQAMCGNESKRLREDCLRCAITVCRHRSSLSQAAFSFSLKRVGLPVCFMLHSAVM